MTTKQLKEEILDRVDSAVSPSQKLRHALFELWRHQSPDGTDGEFALYYNASLELMTQETIKKAFELIDRPAA